MALEITDKNFEEKVLKSKTLVLVDFWAEWCGPCKALGPIIDALATEYAGKAIIGKLDVDQNPKVSSDFRIKSIPTLVFFQNGKEVGKHIGAASKTQIEGKLNEFLSQEKLPNQTT